MCWGGREQLPRQKPKPKPKPQPQPQPQPKQIPFGNDNQKGKGKSKKRQKPGYKPGFLLRVDDGLEVFAETYFAFYGGLVGGDAALEEVGELLHVLKIHEGEGVLGVEGRCDAEAL